MPKYQVSIIQRPEKWEPECFDDVPLKLKGPVEMLTESDDLFAAVERVIEFNQSGRAQQQGRWAVVVEPGSAGRHWPAARLCTPLSYKVWPIWWPDGWEPNSPLDVPNCIRRTGEQPKAQVLGYPQAEATVLALNRQCMDHPGTTWHVVAAVENEPLSQTIVRDASGAETISEVRCIHVLRPSEGGRGDCSRCPAGLFPCAEADCESQPQTVTTRRVRQLGAAAI
ncbi:MAG: hypothetical protein JW959_04280 [Pirellulales bacterium]|nr:hypothetical protein [Pirellulales bacterium]